MPGFTVAGQTDGQTLVSWRQHGLVFLVSANPGCPGKEAVTHVSDLAVSSV